MAVQNRDDVLGNAVGGIRITAHVRQAQYGPVERYITLDDAGGQRVATIDLHSNAVGKRLLAWLKDNLPPTV